MQTNLFSYDLDPATRQEVTISEASNVKGVPPYTPDLTKPGAGLIDRAKQLDELVAAGTITWDQRNQVLEQDRTLASTVASEFNMGVAILREDYHTRGRERGEVAALMRAAMLEAGFPEDRIYVCTDELGSLELGLTLCGEGDLLLYFADKVDEATALLERKRLERESGSGARGPAAGKGPATVP